MQGYNPATWHTNSEIKFKGAPIYNQAIRMVYADTKYRQEFLETFKDEIEEGRELFKSRVSKEIYTRTNFFDRAIIDVIIKPKGHVKSKIW